MKRNVQCVSPVDTVQSAAMRMRQENIGFLPVCDPAHRVVGAVTDRDLAIRVLGAGLPATTPIGDILTPEVVFCRPDDDVHTAEALMGRHQKSRIMCLDPAGRLTGVISLSDIAQHFGRTALQTLREVSGREERD